jgi:hypothetical protein
VTMIESDELAAWRWLLALPRLPLPADDAPLDEHRRWYRAHERQIIVNVAPGKLHAIGGAPMVQVSIAYPGVKGRVRGAGNSLYEAVEMVQSALWQKGMKHQPMLLEYDMQIRSAVRGY